MNILKAFIAGLIFPGFIMPIILAIFSLFGAGAVMGLLSIHFIPWLWGLWNIFYFAALKECLPGDANNRMTLAGAILGLLVAVIAIFFLALPEMIGLTEEIAYLPIVIAPIIYGFLWRIAVKPINTLLGLKS